MASGMWMVCITLEYYDEYWVTMYVCITMGSMYYSSLLLWEVCELSPFPKNGMMIRDDPPFFFLGDHMSHHPCVICHIYVAVLE